MCFVTDKQYVFFTSIIVDLRVAGVADYPIVIDYTPPIAGKIFDGPIFKEDLKFTAGRREVSH